MQQTETISEDELEELPSATIDGGCHGRDDASSQSRWADVNDPAI